MCQPHLPDLTYGFSPMSLLAYRCLQSLAPKYRVSLHFHHTLASLHSSTSGMLLILHARTKRFGNCNFCFLAPSARYSLLKNLHDDSLSLTGLKGLLKTYLFGSRSTVERRAPLSLLLHFVAVWVCSCNINAMWVSSQHVSTRMVNQTRNRNMWCVIYPSVGGHSHISIDLK